MTKISFFAALIFCASLFTNGAAQSLAVNSLSANSTTAAAFFPLSDIKAGMRGTSRTVFAGTKPEEFEVEILGVLPGFIGPKQPAIIARLHGANAERTGVFAGMSGSPVFIDGKIVGAISFSFPFSKEPIAGITPIASMVDNVEFANQTSARNIRTFSSRELAAADFKFDLPNQSIAARSFMANVATGSPLVNLLGQQFAPIATPLVFSGISQESLNQFAAPMSDKGLLPVAAAGGAAEIAPMKKFDDTTLQPGDSVSVALARGDYSMAASGTVTYRNGTKIYAFGHQFLNLGATSMPLFESSVITVVPNANNSFKLAAPQAMVGALGQDRQTGILGKLGEQAEMIPVQINVATSRNRTQTYNFEVIQDQFLTNLLLNITIFNSITATERGLGSSTIAVRGQINLSNAPTVNIERRFSSANAPVFAASSVAAPVGLLIGSNFADAKIKNVRVDIASTDDRRTATLDRLAIDKAEVKAGESFEAAAFIRADDGRQTVQRIPITISADTPAGTYLVYVGDGASLQQIAPSRSFTPKNAAELAKVLNDIKKNDRLYAQVVRVSNGAIVGANELPNLPPSILATLNNDRAVGGVTPTIISPIFERELPAADFVVSGQQVLSINVVR